MKRRKSVPSLPPLEDTYHAGPDLVVRRIIMPRATWDALVREAERRTGEVLVTASDVAGEILRGVDRGRVEARGTEGGALVKRRKPRVTLRCPANAYAGPEERIVEFSFANGEGGLISFRTGTGSDGSNVVNVVNVYCVDNGVTVTARHDDGDAAVVLLRAKERAS